ncbi:MAG: hypothetical protein WCS89_04565 [Candidatus Paceibacterota bacterium]
MFEHRPALPANEIVDKYGNINIIKFNQENMTEKIPENQPPAVETEEINFDQQFPLYKFDRRVKWTKAGSSEGLKESIIELAQECLRGDPKIGVIKFEKIPDGGYEITSFRSRE